MAKKAQNRGLDAVRAIMRAVQEGRTRGVAPAVSPRASGPERKRDRSGEPVKGGAKCANARVSLTSAPEGVELVPTRDVHDRAHAVFEIGEAGDMVLVPACQLNGEARPRLYPRCCMTSGGVSIDSAFDEQHERERRLGYSEWVGLRPEHERLGAVLMRDRVEAGSKHIDRERRAYSVASVARLARGYRERGAISAEECDRLCAADGAAEGPGVSADPE